MLTKKQVEEQMVESRKPMDWKDRLRAKNQIRDQAYRQKEETK